MLATFNISILRLLNYFLFLHNNQITVAKLEQELSTLLAIITVYNYIYIIMKFIIILFLEKNGLKYFLITFMAVCSFKQWPPNQRKIYFFIFYYTNVFCFYG